MYVSDAGWFNAQFTFLIFELIEKTQWVFDDNNLWYFITYAAYQNVILQAKRH